jgi:DNA-binding Lrp family transcriptional regulator
MALERDDLNDMDRWILDFLSKHEWATPNFMLAFYTDDHDHVSRQWVSSRIKRLGENGHVQGVHPNADEYQLVDDPRDD